MKEVNLTKDKENWNLMNYYVLCFCKKNLYNNVVTKTIKENTFVGKNIKVKYIIIINIKTG